VTRVGACSLLTCLLITAPGLASDDRYTVTGLVLDADPSRLTFTASIDAVAGFMPAMTMPFSVRDAADLTDVGPGTMVTFTLVVGRGFSYAEDIRVRRHPNLEQDPARAHRLALFRDVSRGIASRTLQPGDAVPDFTLVDSRRRAVTLSGMRGKVVAINFTYTTCQLPDYCLRLVNHFGALQRRFASALGPDLAFLTITFDPDRDTPEVLADYARQWEPDLDTWHFLTGTTEALEPVHAMFGVVAFPAEGLLDHALHTVLIDRSGRMIANLEGNQFTTDQLGDWIAAAIAARE
jgi:protein SCO1/2